MVCKDGLASWRACKTKDVLAYRCGWRQNAAATQVQLSRLRFLVAEQSSCMHCGLQSFVMIHPSIQCFGLIWWSGRLQLQGTSVAEMQPLVSS